ncbi:MAG: hypothetical protein ACAH59_05610 [Pseudobdellovibrionaceae bacterium]
MTKKTIVRLTAALASGALIILGLGQGCGRWELVDMKSVGGEFSLASEDDPTLLPDTKTVATVYSKQILDHYTTCLGSGLPSDRTLQMYAAKAGTVSETGAVKTVTAPMLMASASIAGEVCRDLIDAERSGTPRIFIGYNLTSTTLPADTALRDVLSRISRSCWSRDADSAEADIVLGALHSSFGNANAANTAHDAALFMCTSMLASLDTLVL